MNLRAAFRYRNTNAQRLSPVPLTVDRLAWSAFGGPYQADLSGQAEFSALFDLFEFLRSPVTIYDQEQDPIWSGFVNQITVQLEQTEITVRLDQLYNRVKVKYSFISPDNKLAEPLETAWSNDLSSQSEYGIREFVILRDGIDDDFALSIRDTFLQIKAWPESVLSHRLSPGYPQVKIQCLGWFQTLDWQSYENTDQFYANHGPGPGTFTVGHQYVDEFFVTQTNARVGQRFGVSGIAHRIKYAYFLMRKEGSPNTITARIYTNSSDTPTSTLLGTSVALSHTAFPNRGFSWIRFTFDPPATFTPSTTMWIVLYPSAVSDVNYYVVRIDEAANYFRSDHSAKSYNGSTWSFLPNLTAPGTRPNLFFRVVGIQDTGTQLQDMATAGNQFFTRVEGITSGVETSPYRVNGYSCLKEIHNLMKLGTSNQRLILARVSHTRQLEFYEQPNPRTPTAWLASDGKFYDRRGTPIKPCSPPVGQFAHLAGTARLSPVWDAHRVPSTFIENVVFDPHKQQLKINSF